MLENLKQMANENNLSFPILADEDLNVIKIFDMFYHGEDAPYKDHGVHGEPVYFFVDGQGKLLYQQQQTSPFSRPTSTECNIIYKKKLKISLIKSSEIK
ncbi:peroxiredoxin family protein [Priestia megaterium]|jgi:peroxiredoxin|nr:peroxiredoxin family protein [Priestia megaterium]NGY80635.1 peroxiredoxin family protein [Priestia megaterium]